MSNKFSKNPKNIEGRFYCTEGGKDLKDGCIGCGYCFASLSEVFAEDEDGFAYVHKQPEDEDEEMMAEEVLQGCPVSSIGKDGDKED